MPNLVVNNLVTDIANYPTNEVRTEIIDFSIVGGGVVLNRGEVFKFRVRVVNEGHLNMRNVRLLVAGTPYAGVATVQAGPFAVSNSFLTAAFFSLDAHGTYLSPYYYGKALVLTPSALPDNTDIIVQSKIYVWDANLDHILVGHSGSGAFEGLLKKEIKPD